MPTDVARRRMNGRTGACVAAATLALLCAAFVVWTRRDHASPPTLLSPPAIEAPTLSDAGYFAAVPGAVRVFFTPNPLLRDREDMWGGTVIITLLVPRAKIASVLRWIDADAGQTSLAGLSRHVAEMSRTEPPTDLAELRAMSGFAGDMNTSVPLATMCQRHLGLSYVTVSADGAELTYAGVPENDMKALLADASTAVNLTSGVSILVPLGTFRVGADTPRIAGPVTLGGGIFRDVVSRRRQYEQTYFARGVGCIAAGVHADQLNGLPPLQVIYYCLPASPPKEFVNREWLAVDNSGNMFLRVPADWGRRGRPAPAAPECLPSGHSMD